MSSVPCGMGNLGEGIDASTSYRSAYIMIGRRSRYAMAFKEYARSSQSRCEPMVGKREVMAQIRSADVTVATAQRQSKARDRKSTRLNSSHSQISYAVFCLKKQNH